MILKTMLKQVGKDAAKTGMKLTYPVLGNLTDGLKNSLENLVGEEYFNASDATKTSYVSNYLLYGLAAYELTEKITKNNEASLLPLVMGAVIGSYYGTAEVFYRNKIKEKNRFSNPHSVLGYVISKPIEYIVNLYENAKAEEAKKLTGKNK